MNISSIPFSPAVVYDFFIRNDLRKEAVTSRNVIPARRLDVIEKTHAASTGNREVLRKQEQCDQSPGPGQLRCGGGGVHRHHGGFRQRQDHAPELHLHHRHGQRGPYPAERTGYLRAPPAGAGPLPAGEAGLRLPGFQPAGHPDFGREHRPGPDHQPHGSQPGKGQGAGCGHASGNRRYPGEIPHSGLRRPEAAGGLRQGHGGGAVPDTGG